MDRHKRGVAHLLDLAVRVRCDTTFAAEAMMPLTPIARLCVIPQRIFTSK